MNSRMLWQAVAISLLFHLCLVLFFVLWRFQDYLAPVAEEADVVFLEPAPPEAVNLPEQRQAARPEEHSPVPAPHAVSRQIVAPRPMAPVLPPGETSAAETVIISPQIDSLLAAADIAGTLMPAMSIMDPDFFPIPLPLIPFTDSGKKKPTLFPLDRLSGTPGAFADRAAEEQYRRSGGGQQPANLMALAAQGVKALEKVLNKKIEPPPRLRKLPTREELAALCAIYARGEPTENEIYKDLGTEIKLTADDLHAVLDGLVNQGILQQEIISPRHEFTFMTPFGSQGVEMSRLNVLNRVYRYRSRIDQAHMMRFLQAAHYYVGTTARPDTAEVRREIRSRMLQLLEVPRQR